jgi:hypothetical protein
VDGVAGFGALLALTAFAAVGPDGDVGAIAGDEGADAGFAEHDEAVSDYVAFRRDMEGLAAERAARMTRWRF